MRFEAIPKVELPVIRTVSGMKRKTLSNMCWMNVRCALVLSSSTYCIRQSPAECKRYIVHQQHQHCSANWPAELMAMGQLSQHRRAAAE